MEKEPGRPVRFGGWRATRFHLGYAAAMSGFVDGQYKWSHGNWVQRHSLSLVLFALLVAQTAHAIWSGHRVWISEGSDHGKTLTGWTTDFWIWWSWEYNVSLVADSFGVLLIVLLSKWFYEQGSAESTEKG